MDRLDESLEAALGDSNRGVTERVQVTRQARSELNVQWAINGTPAMTLSLAAANLEARELLRAVDEHDVRYRRVILKGTFVPPAPRTTESVVVRAVYVRPTLKAMRFKASDTMHGRTILDLADELRLAVELGGHGIPSEPAPTPDDSRPA